MFYFTDYLFSLRFVEKVFDEVTFVGIVFVNSINSLKVITESPIILLKYLPFLRTSTCSQLPKNNF